MTANNELKIGGILLAAGGSSRLGRPKQLVEFQGKTLIRRTAETLVHSRCDPIVVVLGSEIDGSTAELAGLPVNICINTDWQAGMSSSIVSGLNSLLAIEPELDAVLIALCDQPHVTSADIDKLITAFDVARPPIVAARYGETTGVPALFSSELYPALPKLTGDKGAKGLIKNSSDIVMVDIGVAALDIDVENDLDVLRITKK